MGSDQYEPDSEFAQQGPSKTQKKQRSAELQDLGQELTRLSSKDLDRFDLSPELRAAIDLARTLKAGGALKRQIKYIGGLLRNTDPQPIEEQFAALRQQSNVAIRRHHRAERWRERLLAEGDPAITELLGQQPGLDRQQLNQLIRNAKKELEQKKPPRASRMLYRFLAENLDSAPIGTL